MNTNDKGQTYINRESSRGLKFIITELEPQKCEVRTGDKAITVHISLELMSQSWYDWQMKGQYIQDAFNFLRDEEREFLITGITPEEWKRIFSNPSL